MGGSGGGGGQYGDTGMILAQTAGLQISTVPYAVTEGISAFNGSCFQRPDLGTRRYYYH